MINQDGNSMVEPLQSVSRLPYSVKLLPWMADLAESICACQFVPSNANWQNKLQLSAVIETTVSMRNASWQGMVSFCGRAGSQSKERAFLSYNHSRMQRVLFPLNCSNLEACTLVRSEPREEKMDCVKVVTFSNWPSWNFLFRTSHRRDFTRSRSLLWFKELSR